jgi:uncharacterized SAM-binding protein YcdF (DUF218 family)
LKRIRNLVLALLAATGLLLFTVMLTPLVPWWARKLAGPMDDPSGDVLVVLGGSALEDGIIGQSSYWRCVYAVRAWRQTPFPRIIVSGGGPYRPADTMRDFLVSNGVPPDRITVEDRSTTTRENALFTKQILGATKERLVLLTSDYHMPRATRVFEKAGLHVAPRPFPDLVKRSASRPERWPGLVELSKESAKTVYYWLRGWI